MSTQSAIIRAISIVGSQARLAARIGRSQPWVSDVAAGKIATISVDDAFRIVDATEGAVRIEEFAGLAPAPETEAAPDSQVAASEPPAERRSPAGGVSERGAA